MKYLIEIVPGELIDKITILEIKLEKIRDDRKLQNISREYKVLMEVYSAAIVETKELRALSAKLKELNATLWRLEDDIRDKERKKVFDSDFIALARSIYRTNDIRAATKRAINELLNSEFIEEKSYVAY
jgi:hypothetical protein